MNLIEQETPLNPPFPTLKHWSENFCLAAFDPVSGIGMWLHIGRWRKNLTLWRETVILNMPDGTVIAHRAYGNALTNEQGPGGANYCVRVLQKGRKLAYHFDGAARRVQSNELRAGVMADGPKDTLSFDLEFESDADIWDLHDVGNRQDFLGTGHIEQIGRVRGTIRAGAESFEFDGKGNRDHSMGPRDTPTLKSHQWLQGYFDNGVSFLVYDAMLRGKDVPVFCEAVVYEGNRLYRGKLNYGYRIDDAADATRNYGFSIDYEKGTLDIKTTRIVGTAYLSFTVPNDIYVGVVQAGQPPLTLMEQSTHFQLNGTIPGYGNLERTIPGTIGTDP